MVIANVGTVGGSIIGGVGFFGFILVFGDTLTGGGGDGGGCIALLVCLALIVAGILLYSASHG